MGEIIVIGAGAAGLAAAARLCRRGATVTVVDRNPGPGGALGVAGSVGGTGDGPDAASTADTPPPPPGGITNPDHGFDTGAHTLTMPAVFRDLFVKTGPRKASAKATFEENVELRPVDPVRRYVFADGAVLDLPNSSRARVLGTFDAALGRGAGPNWMRAVEHGGAVWELLRPTWFEAPAASSADLRAMLAARSAKNVITPRSGLRKLAKSWFDDPRLGLLLDEYALGYGADPRQAPGVLAVAPYLEHTFGAWRIVGGMSSLTEALYRRAAARGVAFRFGCTVTGITTAADGSANGVNLADGSHLSGDMVVAAIDSAPLAGLTEAGAGTDPGTRAAKTAPRPDSGYSQSIFTVLLRVPGAAEQPHETVYFAGHDKSAVETRLDSVFGRKARPVDDPTIRVCVSREHPESWSVHTYAPRHGSGPGAIDWSAPGLVESYANSLVSALVRRGALGRGATATAATAAIAEEPAATTTEIVRVISPADREQSTGVPGGAVYGPAAHDLSAALLRSPVAQPIPGLYHVGASARPGPGLAFAALSAWHLSELINPTKHPPGT